MEGWVDLAAWGDREICWYDLHQESNLGRSQEVKYCESKKKSPLKKYLPFLIFWELEPPHPLSLPLQISWSFRKSNILIFQETETLNNLLYFRR